MPTKRGRGRWRIWRGRRPAHRGRRRRWGVFSESRIRRRNSAMGCFWNRGACSCAPRFPSVHVSVERAQNLAHAAAQVGPLKPGAQFVIGHLVQDGHRVVVKVLPAARPKARKKLLRLLVPGPQRFRASRFNRQSSRPVPRSSEVCCHINLSTGLFGCSVLMRQRYYIPRPRKSNCGRKIPSAFRRRSGNRRQGFGNPG